MLEEDLAAYAERAARVLKDITTLQAEPVFAEFRVAVKSSAQVSMRLATIEGSLLACCADEVVEIPIGLVLKPDYPSSPPYCRLKLGPGQRATQHPAITPTAVIKQGAVPALANWATQDEDQRSIINVLLSIADTFGEAMPFEEVDCPAAAASAVDLKPQTSLLSSMGSDGGSSPLLPQVPQAAANPLRALGGSPTEGAQLRAGSELSTGPELQPQASASSSLRSSPLQAVDVETTQPDDAPPTEAALGCVLGADLGDLATISLDEAEIEAEVAAAEEAVAAADAAAAAAAATATEPDAEPSPATTTEALPVPVAKADEVPAETEAETEAEADGQMIVEEGSVAATEVAAAAATEPVAPCVAAEEVKVEVEVEVEVAAAEVSDDVPAAAPEEPQQAAEEVVAAPAAGSSAIGALFFGGDEGDAEAEGAVAAVAEEPATTPADEQRGVAEPAVPSADADADADDAIFYQPDARATEATTTTPDMQFLLAGLEQVHEEDLPPLPSAPVSEEAPAVAETAVHLRPQTQDSKLSNSKRKMGQQVSVTLNDPFQSTDVRGNRVVCTQEFNCTNTTKETMASDDPEPVRVTLKVTRRPQGHVFLGVVGTRADKTELSKRVVGEAELEPSLGCGIRDGAVVLYYKDKTFFKGDCDTRNPTFITMRMHNKQLTFFIDGCKVDSDDLEGMKLSGSFHIGVSLTKPGQEAEIVEVLTGPEALEKPWFRDNELVQGDAATQMLHQRGKMAEAEAEAEAEAAPVVEATGAQAEDEEGSTSLHSAARSGRLDTVKFLARECPELCAAQDGEGSTPLHAAAKAGNLAIVKFLAAECSETCAVQDKEGNTPAGVAARHGYGAIVAFLETGECPETEAAPPAALPDTLSRLLGLGGDAGGGNGDGGGGGGASDPVSSPPQPTLGYTADGRVDATLRFGDIFSAGDMEEDATPDGRVAKRQLVEAIGERLARDKAVVVQSEEARLNRAAASRESWDLGRDTLRQAVSVLHERRASLLDAIPGVDAAIAEAEQAERSAEEFVDASGEVFLDLIQPDTPLGKQNLELDTSDKAIEDCLYALDQGLKKDIIDAHQYQRLVLDLARRQFECRALQRKIRLKTEAASRDGFASSRAVQSLMGAEAPAPAQPQEGSFGTSSAGCPASQKKDLARLVSQFPDAGMGASYESALERLQELT